MWREVTAADGVTMLAMAAVSYYAATVGVARSRCGEYLKTPEFFRWLGRLLDRLLDPAPEAGLPFRSPAHAQFWFEWRQKGWVLPAIVLFALTVGFFGWLLFNRNPRDLFAEATAGGAFLPVAGLIVGLIFGNANTNSHGGTLEMGPFHAARPMTSPDMSRTMLRVAAVSVAVAWVIWAAAYLALYAILPSADVASRSLVPFQVYFPLALLGTWLALTCTATIGQTGRPILFAILFCGVPAVTVGVVLFSNFALTRGARQTLDEGITVLVGVVFLLGTTSSFVAARRRSMIGWPTVSASIGVWMALCVLLALFWWQH